MFFDDNDPSPKDIGLPFPGETTRTVLSGRSISERATVSSGRSISERVSEVIPSRCTSGDHCKHFTCGIIFVVILTGVVLLATSLKRLDSTEYGLEYTKYAKTLGDDAEGGGLHWGPPGYIFLKFPSTFITANIPQDSDSTNHTSTCVSRDGLRVGFSLSFQYQIPKEWIPPAVRKYRNFDKWSKIVVAAGNSAVQHSCAEFETANFQNQRAVIQNKMEDNLRLKLEGTKGDGSDGVYARAISLQLHDVTLPAAYDDAVSAKQSAEEGISLAINQRLQKTTTARTEFLAAEKRSKKIEDTSVNDAKITLMEARIKANETTYAFEKEAEVIKFVKKSLGLNTDGVMAFLYNKLLEDVKTLRVSAAEPAKLSRRDEL